MELKVISVKKYFKNGNIRIIAKNIWSNSIKYYSLENCPFNNINAGDLLICEPLNKTFKISFNGRSISIERINFIRKELIISNENYFKEY